MATVVDKVVEIAAPVTEVFAYVDDFTRTQDWMYGLHHIEPVGDQLRGVGATYDGVMKLGVRLTSRLRCTAWEEHRLIELTSVQGIRNAQRWEFTEVAAGRTRVGARITYSLPGGPAGLAMARAMKPFVGVAISQTSQALVRNLESR